MPRYLGSRAHIPLEPRQPPPDDVSDAARELLAELRISRSAWRYACQVIGPYPGDGVDHGIGGMIMNRGIA